MSGELTALCGECRLCLALREVLDSGSARWLGDVCLQANGRGGKPWEDGRRQEFGRQESQCMDLLRDALRMPTITTGLARKATAEQSPPKSIIPWWMYQSVFGSEWPVEALVPVYRDTGGRNAEIQ